MRTLIVGGVLTIRTLIVSPHTDDAIFSLGSFIHKSPNEITILSVFAGIPTDEAGKKKHEKLLQEHSKACDFLGVNHIEGDFLDDVYTAPSVRELTKWLGEQISGFEKIVVPLGIQHSDHILIRSIFYNSFRIDGFYEELPYRALYPELTEVIRSRFASLRSVIETESDDVKAEAIKIYSSQIKGQDVVGNVMQTERILW